MDNTTKYSIPRVKGSQLSCTLVGTLSVLFNLRDTAVLLHGTAGCAHYGMKFCQQMMLRETEIIPGYRPLNLNFRTTALTENELIFGGEERLSQKIREMLDAFPDMPLLVIPSCTVEVIGDDVSGICERIARETGRTVVYFNMGGFLKGDHYEGLNSAYFDLIDRFLSPSDVIRPKTVNLVAERSLIPIADIDYFEVCRLLELLDVKVNTRFMRDLPFHDLSRVTQAQLNLPAINNQTIAVCERLYEKFGTPYIREGFPCGFSDTHRWLQAIDQALSLGTDVDALMKAERAIVSDEINRLGNPFAGMKIVINTVPIHLGWLNEFLALTGADLVEVNLLDSGYFQQDFMDRLGEFSCDVNTDMKLEDIVARNLEHRAGLYLQCSVHLSPMPNYQPGVLIKEIPVIPPVGPRGLLDLFVNWSQWMRSTTVEGWRNECLDDCM